MVVYTRSKSNQELNQIIALQAENLPSNISREEAQSQGFVTVIHDLNMLGKMNSPYPHVIAKNKKNVIGFALVMLKNFANEIPVLVPMFEKINELTYNSKPLINQKYFVMGQICIAKEYRGQGILQGLYELLGKAMKDNFDYIITEISKNNLRSQRAHEKIGFELLSEYTASDGLEWKIIILKLKSN
jgi:ribosomal protein S18 acetylase RimI-like enzyme